MLIEAVYLSPLVSFSIIALVIVFSIFGYFYTKTKYDKMRLTKKVFLQIIYIQGGFANGKRGTILNCCQKYI